MALPPNRSVRTIIDRPWITERHASVRDKPPLLRRIEALRNATDANGTSPITSVGLVLGLAYSIIASFLTWILLGLVTSTYLVRYSGSGRRPSFKERVRLAVTAAIMMTAIQYSLMTLKVQTPVSISYEVTMTGQQGDQACHPIWKLAIGSWFLALGVSLTIVGVYGIALEAGKWVDEMKGGADSVAEEALPPQCP